MQRIHRTSVRSQHWYARAVQSQLVKHTRARLLQCIGTVLASSRVVVVKEEPGDEAVEERVMLEQELLVLVGARDGGDSGGNG